MISNGMYLYSPNIAYADFNSVLAAINSRIINPLIELLFALAIAFFLWGLVSFIMNSSNEEKKTTGKMHMIWGVIGLAIMLGVWGILNLILTTMDIPRSQIDPENNIIHLQ